MRDTQRHRPAHGAHGDKRRNGAILVIVLVVLILITIVGSGMFAAATANARETGRSIGAAQAFWAAEAGIEHAKAYAQKNRKKFAYIHPSSTSAGNMLGTNVISTNLTMTAYSVDILDDPAWNNNVNALQKYIITARGTAQNGTVQTVSIRGSLWNFASYSHATQFENGVSFAPDDVIDGPVYSNDQLKLYGPYAGVVFLTNVWSSASTVNYANGANSNAFKIGITLNAGKLFINDPSVGDPIMDIYQVALIGSANTNTVKRGFVLTNVVSGVDDYNIKFNPNGSFTSQNIKSGTITTNLIASANIGSTTGTTIYVKGDVYVQGVVSGQVTIACHGAMYITNGIEYATATNPAPWKKSGNDYISNPAFVNANVMDSLGLIASNKVLITGTKTINVHAAIMVTGTNNVTPVGFGAVNYTKTYSPQPRICLLGGITQYRRGTVGQVGGVGFLKRYKYDQRFVTVAPPNYPPSLYTYDRYWQSGIP